MSDVVRRYYDSDPEREWQRLARGRGRIEIASTLRLIDKYFPLSGHIADIGAGPGRYAIELMKRGYDVTLFDLSPQMIEFARARIDEAGLRAVDAHCDDARDLGMFNDEMFDGVLLLGPMYHIIRKEDRLRVLSETRRILKPGAPAVIAYLNSWGILRCGVAEFPDAYNDIAYIRAFLGERVYEGEQPGFTEAYDATPPLAVAEVESVGLKLISYAGAEGFASGMASALVTLSEEHPQAFENVVRVAAETGELRQYRDATEHLHIVAHRA